MMNRGNLPAVSFLLSILLLSLLSCIPPKATPIPSPAPASPPPLTFRLYHNDGFGFSLEYPEGWRLSETGGLSPIVTITAPERFPIISVSLRYLAQPSSSREQAGKAVKDLERSLEGLSLLGEGELGIGYAVELAWGGEGESFRGWRLYVVRGMELFIVAIEAPSSVYDRDRELLERILKSFRLERKTLRRPPKGTLRLYGVDPVTLDPALSREWRSQSYIVQIFGGLVTFDKDLNIIPDLARDWEVSADGRTYTFYLRKGVRFHDGREVTAFDVKFAWERATDPSLGSPTAITYLGDIVGVREKLAGRAREITGVRVLDRYTLQVTIDAPKSYFLAKLAYPVAFVVDKDNVAQGPEWWRRPNGTGPFKLKEWRPGEWLILEANTRYHLGPPKLERVIYRLWGGIPMVMYEKGEIDVASVSLAGIERATDPAGPFYRELRVVPEFSLSYLGFNLTRPPFDDPAVRRAFALSVDRDRLIRIFLKNMASRADGILPPGFPGYNPELKPIPYDPEEARRLLASSKYGVSLPTITVTIAGEGGGVPHYLLAMLLQWRENLGVDFRIREINPEAYFYKLKEEKDDIFALGWIADYPDPQNFLDVLFHSESPENFGGYSNPELDRLLEQARVERDREKRLALYNRIEEMVMEDMPILPLWFGRSYILVKPYVKDFTLTPLGFPLLHKVYLEGR